eukprot:TRINITY_DN83295_c0_g1_i1.p1 TRINITY_DN83295_c0_g1~~TRINITY_DN83295_c0_g1_i1.p1  ORF type:complete len:330 (-),score=44.46 TRINITY_DN83295_c0_g1_i1:8-997(-)
MSQLQQPQSQFLADAISQVLEQLLEKKLAGGLPQQTADERRPADQTALVSELRGQVMELTQRLRRAERLRERYRELLLENTLAVEQIAVLRIKCIDLQVTLDAERDRNAQLVAAMQRQASAETTLVHPPIGQAPDHAKAASPSFARSPRRPTSPATAKSSRTSQEPVVPKTPPPPRTVTEPATVATPNATKQAEPRSQLSDEPVGRRASYPRSTAPAPRAPHDQQLAHRMLRALSPPPSKGQAATLVDEMAQQLVTELKALGVSLPLKKVKPAVYELGNKRVNLVVHSDRLSIRLGGGHEDFLQYLVKSKAIPYEQLVRFWGNSVTPAH